MWDLVVVGSGGAAMAAGIAASEAGRSVLLIETARVGGTCVNRGCVPSKHLLHSAGRRFEALRSAVPGIATSAGPVDRAVQLAAKDALIEQLVSAKYLGVAAAHGFDIRIGTARFASPDLLAVDGEPLPAHAYLLATGAAPARPDLNGLPTSTRWTRPPR
jgi:mercuric reductase